MSKSVEIVRNNNGVYIRYPDSSINDQLASLLEIISTIDNNNEYDEREKKIISDTAKCDHRNLSIVASNVSKFK